MSARSILRTVFGYESFRGHQEAIIDEVMAGGDALVLMPTGGGKSLCYQIPAIAREGVGIVVSPLIALMQDQVASLRESGVRAAYVNSTLAFETARRVESDMVAGKYDLVYAAPERLTTEAFLELLAKTKVSLFAIDEAHCVSQWGHDFRPEYRKLDVLAERFPGVPRMALTATADEPTRREIVEHLKLQKARHFISGFDRPNIRYQVVAKNNAKSDLLRFLKRNHAGECGIVYCLSRRSVDQTTVWLEEQGVPALPYHAGLDKAVRERNQRRFLEEENLVMVATIAFGLGIDKPNVRFVAHLNLPKSLEAYYQETGRAGRDGLPSSAFMTYGYGDAVLIRQLVERSEAPAQRKRVEHLKLNALLGYCETSECRRAVLLRYFGEEHGGNCGNCDTCLNPVPTYDGTVVAQKALSNVYRSGYAYGASYLADILVGTDNERIRQKRHHQITTFAIGRELDRNGWVSVYRQLVAAGLLDVDPEHGGLRLSSLAGAVLKGKRKVQLRQDPKRTTTGRPEKKDRAADSTLDRPEERDLFALLRELRRELATAKSVPAYVIFHDRTLAEMARAKPTSLSALALVPGVGEAKLERYGEQVLSVIRHHLESTRGP